MAQKKIIWVLPTGVEPMILGLCVTNTAQTSFPGFLPWEQGWYFPGVKFMQPPVVQKVDNAI